MTFTNIFNASAITACAQYYLKETTTFAEPYFEVAFNGKLAEVASDFFKVNIHENIYLNTGAVFLGSGLISKSLAHMKTNGISLRSATITALGAGILIAGAVNGTNTNDEICMNITLVFIGAATSAALSRVKHKESPKIDKPNDKNFQNQTPSDSNVTVKSLPLDKPSNLVNTNTLQDNTDALQGPYNEITSAQ